MSNDEAWKLDDLAAFVRIARLGSYTRAAAELATSTSNLSHAIAQLEKRLGYRLLQRTSRSVSATEAGAQLLLTLEPALHDIEEALNAVDIGRGAVAGTLRITATREGYDAIVRPTLSAFTTAHPHTTVEVLVEYGFRDVVADRFDAGIRLGEKLEQDMIAVKLGHDLRMAVVASPTYLAEHGVPKEPRELVDHRCINYRMVAAGSIYAWEFEKRSRPFTVQVTGPLTFNEPELMLDAAVNGLGVAYVLEDKAAPSDTGVQAAFGIGPGPGPARGTRAICPKRLSGRGLSAWLSRVGSSPWLYLGRAIVLVPCRNRRSHWLICSVPQHVSSALDSNRFCTPRLYNKPDYTAISDSGCPTLSIKTRSRLARPGSDAN